MNTSRPYNPGGDDWRRRAEAAERTVEVLKDKVSQLYAGGSGNLIQRQLDRQRQRRVQLQLRAAELERYNGELERAVEERTRAMRAILDNVTFGFFVMGRDLTVKPCTTRSCVDLFGRPIAAGDNLPELLGVQDTPLAAHLALAIDQVFDDLLDEDVALGQIPTRFVVGERELKLEGRVVRDAEGAISGVLMTVSDETALEQARRQARENEVLVHILMQRSAFVAFVEETRAAVLGCSSSDADPVVVRRVVHTIKGNAAAFGLDDVVAAAHSAESEPHLGPEQLARIGGALRELLQTHVKVLEIPPNAHVEPTFEVTEAQLGRLRALLDRIDDTELEHWASEVAMRPVSELLGPTETFVQRLAERLNKQLSFEVHGGHKLLNTERFRPVFVVLPHLLRNAVAHGIEEPWERGDKGSCGHVTLEVSGDAEGCRIVVTDDGRGVDLDRVVDRAVKLGLCAAEDQSHMSTAERLSLVYLDGLSVSETVSDIAGRGVGMAAVKAVVAEAGGNMMIESQPGLGTRVSLHFPATR